MLPGIGTTPFKGVKMVAVLACFLGTVSICSGWQGTGPHHPVFPGAEGFGTETSAGRGGDILKVTNVNDSGPGSFRAAVETSGPRIIVFEVGGSIELRSAVYIRNPFLTIAGQTAPEPGIQFKNYGIEIDSHDVLVQHIRIRVSGGERDCLRIFPNKQKVYNIVVDHVTANWGSDENMSIFGPGGAENITISNCMIAEAGYGLLIGSDEIKPKIINNISILKNLFAHNSERNPMIKNNSSVFFVNNLGYNTTLGFVGLIGDFSSQVEVSLVGNHWVTGFNNLYSPIIAMSSFMSGFVYEKDSLLTGVISPPLLNDKGRSCLTPNPPIWDDTVSISPVAGVKGKVTAFAGARPAYRDAVERRIVNDVLLGTGSQKTSGVWPAVYNNTTYKFFDAGSNPHGDDDRDGYTNIEEILHQMAEKVEGR